MATFAFHFRALALHLDAHVPPTSTWALFLRGFAMTLLVRPSRLQLQTWASRTEVQTLQFRCRTSRLVACQPLSWFVWTLSARVFANKTATWVWLLEIQLLHLSSGAPTPRPFIELCFGLQLLVVHWFWRRNLYWTRRQMSIKVLYPTELYIFAISFVDIYCVNWLLRRVLMLFWTRRLISKFFTLHLCIFDACIFDVLLHNLHLVDRIRMSSRSSEGLSASRGSPFTSTSFTHVFLLRVVIRWPESHELDYEELCPSNSSLVVGRI